MSDITFIMHCPMCGARNRVRLVTGSRVRVRCGNCGEIMPLEKRRVFAMAAWQGTKNFFGRHLPNILLALVDVVFKVLAVLFGPLRALLRRLPANVGRRLGWGVIGLLTVGYLVVEDTLTFSSLLTLVALLALAMVAVMLAVRGPRALVQMFRKIIRECPSCGHRHFGWLKSCPRCGREGG